MTSVLVLGGSNFVGRAVVGAAVDRGWAVTTLNRGRGWAHPDVEALHGDRTAPDGLDALARREWDLVVDTWSEAARVVQASARTLAGRVPRYAYVSSGSVYADLSTGPREDATTVSAQAGAEAAEYAADKRGAELAVLEAFGDRALLARAGLILGPFEDVGRLPWWLGRMARGGEVLAPGPPGRPLQLVDARDLAAFVLDTTATGPVNVVSRPGHTTIGAVLEACREVAAPAGTELRWADPSALASAGVEPWTELPLWLPADHAYAGMLAMDVERAHAEGLRCRPVEETVRDTWAWLTSLDGPARTREDRSALGLDPAREHELLAGLAAAPS